MAYYLAAVFRDGDPQLIAMPINDVAHARGMTEIARKVGVSREGLYKSLSANTKPKFATIQKVIRAFDLDLTVSARA
ncbi:MAG: putative addiction module antidote protein [Alphaproteobacteria bacterium]|nr:putative addiction module antidote protein [Alphaproteobacteria bacterium]MCL2505950.1 putative addiction module antidote protein [Alphaproteobacteria bacterium]